MIQRLPFLILLATGLVALAGCSGGSSLLDTTPIINFIGVNNVPAHEDGTPAIAVDAGTTVHLKVSITDPGGDSVSVMWSLEDDTSGTLTDPTSRTTDWKIPASHSHGNITATMTATDTAGKSVDGTVVVLVN